jgi:hypothetical protein
MWRLIYILPGDGRLRRKRNHWVLVTCLLLLKYCCLQFDVEAEHLAQSQKSTKETNESDGNISMAGCSGPDLKMAVGCGAG